MVTTIPLLKNRAVAIKPESVTLPSVDIYTRSELDVETAMFRWGEGEVDADHTQGHDVLQAVQDARFEFATALSKTRIRSQQGSHAKVLNTSMIREEAGATIFQ